MYIHGRNDTRKEDNETLEIAKAYRDKKELELLEDQTGLQFGSWRAKANFIEYFLFKVKMKKNDTGSNWNSTYLHLKNFTKGKIQFKHIDEKFCESFKDYLLEKVSNNSVSIYFTVFKTVLKKALKEKIITLNPAIDIQIKGTETVREFLTLDEVKKLNETPCKDNDVKNAFLFSCFTGLRISDIRNIEFNNIENNYIRFTQKKTYGIERMKLSQEALKIVAEQKLKNQNSNNDKIFELKTKGHVLYILKEWTQAAGITKHITFHCARHTFATMCLTYDVDLYTVSKLLGHKDIQSTQIYAKLIDKKKDEAIDKLPNFGNRSDQD